jgi:hypothetical protein
LISISQFFIREITAGSILIFVELEINIIGCFNTPLYVSQLAFEILSFIILVSHFLREDVISPFISIFHSLKKAFPVVSSFVSSNLIFCSCVVGAILCSSSFLLSSTIVRVSTLFCVEGILLILI